jgi:hypothetical protein
MPVSIAVVATHTDTGNMNAYLVQYSVCKAAVCASSTAEAAFEWDVPKERPRRGPRRRRHPPERFPTPGRAVEADGRARAPAVAATTPGRTAKDARIAGDDADPPPTPRVTPRHEALERLPPTNTKLYEPSV